MPQSSPQDLHAEVCRLQVAGCRLAGSVQFVLSATEGVMVKNSIALPI